MYCGKVNDKYWEQGVGVCKMRGYTQFLSMCQNNPNNRDRQWWCLADSNKPGQEPVMVGTGRDAETVWQKLLNNSSQQRIKLWSIFGCVFNIK